MTMVHKKIMYHEISIKKTGQTEQSKNVLPGLYNVNTYVGMGSTQSK